MGEQVARRNPHGAGERPAGHRRGDADLLKQAFNIKTVGDLGKNKHFRAARLLAQLSEAGAK